MRRKLIQFAKASYRWPIQVLLVLGCGGIPLGTLQAVVIRLLC